MVGERIRELREKFGISQADLAKRIGVSRSTESSWEAGLGSPNSACLIDLAKIFHVSTDYLLGIEKQLTINTRGLTDIQKKCLYDIIECFQKSNQ